VLTFEDDDAHHDDHDDHDDHDAHDDLDSLSAGFVIFVNFAIVVCRRSVSPLPRRN
jgi:hypothetical protein